MATFTLTLKRVIELTGGTTEVAEDGVTRLTGGNIGLGYVQTHDPDHAPVLIGKIVDHYFMREIGTESVDLFQLNMRKRMAQIMPYYNDLYKSLDTEFDPLSTVDITTTNDLQSSSATETESESTASNESGGTSRTVSSEFPQTQLNNNADYASSAADANSASTSDSSSSDGGTSSTEGDQSSSGTTKGYQGSAAALMLQYRESLINIDLMIIAELENLFMGIYSTGDEYSTGYWRY